MPEPPKIPARLKLSSQCPASLPSGSLWAPVIKCARPGQPEAVWGTPAGPPNHWPLLPSTSAAGDESLGPAQATLTSQAWSGWDPVKHPVGVGGWSRDLGSRTSTDSWDPDPSRRASHPQQRQLRDSNEHTGHLVLCWGHLLCPGCHHKEASQESRVTVWGRAGCSEPGDWEEEAVAATGWMTWKESWAVETAPATGGLCLGIDRRCRQAGGWGFLRDRCPGVRLERQVGSVCSPCQSETSLRPAYRSSRRAGDKFWGSQHGRELKRRGRSRRLGRVLPIREVDISAGANYGNALGMDPRDPVKESKLGVEEARMTDTLFVFGPMAW